MHRKRAGAPCVPRSTTLRGDCPTAETIVGECFDARVPTLEIPLPTVLPCRSHCRYDVSFSHPALLEGNPFSTWPGVPGALTDVTARRSTFTRNLPLVLRETWKITDQPKDAQSIGQSGIQPNPQTSAGQDPRDPGPRISVGRSRGLTHVSVSKSRRISLKTSCPHRPNWLALAAIGLVE